MGRMGRKAMATLVAAVSTCLLLGGLASAQGTATVNVATNAKYGQILVNAQGMTLYMFTKDKTGTSACYTVCAKIWPALTTTSTPTLQSGVPGTLGTATRKGGSHQVTYNGMPLYTFSGDKAAGDTSGQGFKNLWYVIHPKAMAVKAAASSTSTASLPKTGSNPVADALGLILLGAGGGLALWRRRTTAGRRD